MIRSLVVGRVQTSAADSTLEGSLDVRTVGPAGPSVYSFDYNIGTVAKPTPILARDLGISAVSGDGTQVLWIFGDTFCSPFNPVAPTNGESFRYTTSAVGTTATAPGSMTSLTHTYDAQGAPQEFVTPQGGGTSATVRFPYWPDSVFPHPTGTGWIVYYQRVRNTPGFANYYDGYVGSFIFTPDQVCVADVSKAAANSFSRTGNEVVVMDGWEGMSSGCCLGRETPTPYIYLFTQTWNATIQHYVARVPYTSYKTPGAYTYWTGSGWSADRTQKRAVVLAGNGHDGLAGMGGITVTWNAYLAKWLMVHTRADVPSNYLCLRTADNPWGPFSEPTKLFTPHNMSAGNEGYGIYTGREHKWAQKDGGRVIYTSHFRGLPGFLQGELKLTEIKFGPDPTIPTNIVTPPAGGHALSISNALDAGDVTLAPGIYELDMRAHPQNAAYRTAITVPNDRTFDFSQAELRLKPGQQRVTSGGVTTGQQSSIISNRGLGSVGNQATNVTIVVGCLNGNGINQGAGTATANQQDADQAWMDGIELRNPLNCLITGSATSPWARQVTAQHGNGSTLTVNVRGIIKNVRGWDGGGGDTETFYYTFDDSRGGNVAEFLELTIDDGGVRSATGWSSNGPWNGTVTTTPSGVSASNYSVTHRNIYSHGLKSHGGTAWHTNFVRVQDSLTEQQNAAGFRFEYGWGHSVSNVISRDTAGTTGSHNGLNLKGEQTPAAGTTMLVATTFTIENVEHGVQVNSIVGANLQGWANWDSAGGRDKINFVDALYSNRASTGVVTTNFITF